MAAKAIAARILASVLADDELQYGDMADEFEQLEALCEADPKLRKAYMELENGMYAAKGALAECIEDLEKFIKA